MRLPNPNEKMLTKKQTRDFIAMVEATSEISNNINFYRLCTGNNIEQLVYNKVKDLNGIADSEKKEFAKTLADIAKDFKEEQAR